MKNVLPLLLFCLLSISAAAQKLEKEEIDNFNSTKTVPTTKEGLVTAFGVSQVAVQGFIFTEKDSTTSYGLFFYLKPYFTGSLREGAKLLCLPDSGEPVEFTYSGKYDLFSAGDNVIFSCTPTKEQLEFLSKRKITAVRIELSSRLDYDIKKNKQELLANISKLLLAN